MTPAVAITMGDLVRALRATLHDVAEKAEARAPSRRREERPESGRREDEDE